MLVVGGLTLGADPIAYSVAMKSYLEGSPIKPFVVRKEPKALEWANQLKKAYEESAKMVPEWKEGG